MLRYSTNPVIILINNAGCGGRAPKGAALSVRVCRDWAGLSKLPASP